VLDPTHLSKYLRLPCCTPTHPAPHHRWTSFITQTDTDQTSSEWIDIDIEMETKLNAAYDEVRGWNRRLCVGSVCHFHSSWFLDSRETQGVELLLGGVFVTKQVVLTCVCCAC
jgi:hypothetical protein